MKFNLVGPFVVNDPFGTEIAFAKGLRQNGVEVVEVDPNIDTGLDGLAKDADATVIFKSAVGNERHLHKGGGSKIVYQPDDARFEHIKAMIEMMRQHTDLLLSFDTFGADLGRMLRYRASEVLLLTADDELYCPSSIEIERDIDVSFVGSLGDPVAHASRRKMIQIVERAAISRRWKISFGTTQDIPVLLDIYRRSKVVLNHATDVGQRFGMGFGFQCRHFEVGMTRTCLLSNKLIGENRTVSTQPHELYFSEFGPYESTTGESSLIRQLELLLTNDVYKICADELYQSVMKSHRPIHRAKQLIDFVKRHS